METRTSKAVTETESILTMPVGILDCHSGNCVREFSKKTVKQPREEASEGKSVGNPALSFSNELIFKNQIYTEIERMVL